MNTVQRYCLCFLVLSQQLLLLTVASVIRRVELDVPTTWQKIYAYNNRHTYPVRGMSRWTKGLKSHITGRTLIADTDAGEEVPIGEMFQLSSINVSFTDGHSFQEDALSQEDLYGSKKVHTTYVTIPPLTKLTRWQLVATVAGHEIGFEHFVDTFGGDKPPVQRSSFLRTGTGVGYDDGYISDRGHQLKQLGSHDSAGRAVLLIGQSLSMQPIIYGSTRIRIKHLFTNQYLTVFRSFRRLAATLKLSDDFHFVLYSSPNGTMIKTLNPLQPKHEWLAAAGANGNIYFAEDNGKSKVYWVLNKEGQLYDGDTVTFSNSHHRGSGLCYFHKAPTTNVYSLAGRRDEWILEVV